MRGQRSFRSRDGHGHCWLPIWSLAAVVTLKGLFFPLRTLLFSPFLSEESCQVVSV